MGRLCNSPHPPTNRVSAVHLTAGGHMDQASFILENVRDSNPTLASHFSDRREIIVAYLVTSYDLVSPFAVLSCSMIQMNGSSSQEMGPSGYEASPN